MPSDSIIEAVGRALASTRPLTLEAETTRVYLTEEETVWANTVVALTIALAGGSYLNQLAFGDRDLITECLVQEVSA